MDSSHAPVANPATANGALDLVMAGGPVVWLLIAMSVIALTIIIYKIVQFGMAGIGRSGNTEKAVELYRNGHRREALAAVRHGRHRTFR